MSKQNVLLQVDNLKVAYGGIQAVNRTEPAKPPP